MDPGGGHAARRRDRRPVRAGPALLPVPGPHAALRPVGHRQHGEPARRARDGAARAGRPDRQGAARRHRAGRRGQPLLDGERLAAAGRADGPITKAFMNWALAQVLPADASVVSEYWARPELLPRPGR